MKRLATLILMLAGLAAAAQNYSGIWNGAGGKVDSRYGTVPERAQMTILQDGNAGFSGTIKLGNGKPVAITAGAISGSQLTFQLHVANGGQITGTLTPSGTQLAGRMTTSAGQVYNFVFTKLQ